LISEVVFKVAKVWSQDICLGCHREEVVLPRDWCTATVVSAKPNLAVLMTLQAIDPSIEQDFLNISCLPAHDQPSLSKSIHKVVEIQGPS
jgi:hypothetical protein